MNATAPTAAEQAGRAEWFDTHAHLADDQLVDQVDDVIARAAAAGVTRLLAVGTTLATSHQCQELAAGHSHVWASAGIHPNHALEAAAGDWDEILRLASEARVVALGETGLDRYWDFAPFAVQQDYFARHLELSRRIRRPFIVHMRDCESDVLAMLAAAHSHGPLLGVMHSFTGSAEAAAQCMEWGMYISFAGMVTYKKSDELRSIAAAIRADRLLVETDSPYLSPHPCRGQRPNEPALLVHTGECLAAARSVTVDQLAQQTTANARALFGVD